MRRSWLGLAGLVVVLAAHSCQAQQGLPMYSQPATGPNGNGTQGWAPWLNMLNNNNFSGPGNTGGGNTGFNIPGVGAAVQYFGIVRPEQQYGQSINQLQSQVTRMQMMPQVGPPRNQGIADTGVPARFMSYGGYFNTSMIQRNQTNARGR